MTIRFFTSHRLCTGVGIGGRVRYGSCQLQETGCLDAPEFIPGGSMYRFHFRGLPDQVMMLGLHRSDGDTRVCKGYRRTKRIRVKKNKAG